MRRYLFALVVGAAVAAAGEARAQFVRGPGGSLGFPNPNGTYTFVHPGRLVPGAGVPLPGTLQQSPFGPVWAAPDGQVHGNLLDFRGDLHLIEYSGAGSPRGGARAPAGARTGQRWGYSTSAPAASPRWQPGQGTRRGR
jgi:hypothetical protein